MLVTSFDNDDTYVRGCLDDIASTKGEQVPDQIIDEIAKLRLRMEYLTKELHGKKVKELRQGEKVPTKDDQIPLKQQHQKQQQQQLQSLANPDTIYSLIAKGTNRRETIIEKQILLAKVVATPQSETIPPVPRLKRSESSKQPCSTNEAGTHHHLPSNIRQLRRAWSDRDFEKAYGSGGWTRELKNDGSTKGEVKNTPAQNELNTKKLIRKEVDHHKRERSATMEKDYEYIAPNGKQFTHRRKSKSLSALVEIDTTSSSVNPFSKEKEEEKDLYSYIKSTKKVGGRPRQASSTRIWESLPASIEYNDEEKDSSERKPRFRSKIFGSKNSRTTSADSRLPGVAV
jgi:hypothetical protein